MKKVVRAQALDLWIIRYFKVLPTDQRFRELTDAQKNLILTSFFESPLDEWAHMSYHQTLAQMDMDDTTKENLVHLGYSKDQILRMTQQLKIAQEEM